MSGAKLPPPPPTESPRPPSLPMTLMRRRRRIRRRTRRFSEGRNGADETGQLPRPWPLFIPHSLRRGRRRRTFWQGALSPSLSSESKRVSQSPQEIYDRNPPPPPHTHTSKKHASFSPVVVIHFFHATKLRRTWQIGVTMDHSLTNAHSSG